jgi:hypothetical protein
MVASSETEVLQLEELYLPNTLSKLELIGQLEKKRMPQIIPSWSHLHNLTRLSLLFSKLDEDAFSSLMVLRGLCFLEHGNAYDGKKLCFSALSFPALKKLGIWGAPQLSQVEIEEGGLRNLVKLWFLQCPELKCLPNGIECLTSLEDLYLYDTAQELIEKLRREVNECSELYMKIRHIRRVSVKLTKENMWERIRWQDASIPTGKTYFYTSIFLEYMPHVFNRFSHISFSFHSRVYEEHRAFAFCIGRAKNNGQFRGLVPNHRGRFINPSVCKQYQILGKVI